MTQNELQMTRLLVYRLCFGGLNEKHKALRAKMVCNVIAAEIFLAKTFPCGVTVKLRALYTQTLQSFDLSNASHTGSVTSVPNAKLNMQEKG
jgi:hypothetical protein